MNIIENAIELAMRAHQGQTRKESKTAYFVHPVTVALLLARYNFDEVVIAAALVHDVLEDSEITIQELREVVGKEVVLLVVPITHDNKLSWEEKKQAYIESVRNASENVKAIATADKIANAKSLLEAYASEGTAVWRYFNAGRDKKIWFEKNMLSMLQETWVHPLVDEYALYVAKLEKLV